MQVHYKGPNGYFWTYKNEHKEFQKTKEGLTKYQIWLYPTTK